MAPYSMSPTCDTSPGSTTGVGDTQTGREAGLGICKIPSGMEQSCGPGRAQTWPLLTTTPEDKSFIPTGRHFRAGLVVFWGQHPAVVVFRKATSPGRLQAPCSH